MNELGRKTNYYADKIADELRSDQHKQIRFSSKSRHLHQKLSPTHQRRVKTRKHGKRSRDVRKCSN